MTRFVSLPMLALAVLCAGTGIAGAQSMVDMKGTWTGMSKSIVSGLPPHHPTSTPSKLAGPHRLTELKITIKIEGQQDGRVWGTLGSAAKVEPIIGVLSPDGKRLRMVAEGGGIVDGTVVNTDTIDIFYTEHQGGVSVAATNVWTRQK
jgi:hypothetical protein